MSALNSRPQVSDYKMGHSKDGGQAVRSLNAFRWTGVRIPAHFVLTLKFIFVFYNWNMSISRSAHCQVKFY